MPVALIRYWGSYFKSPRAARGFATIFAEAARRGWRSYLVCCRPPGDKTWLEPLREVGARLIYLPRPRGNFDPACMWRAHRLCRELRCNVFHCDNMHTSPLIGAAAAGVRVRLWSKRSMEPSFEQERTPTLRERVAVSVRVSCALATRVLAVSRAVRDELLGLGIRSSKVLVFQDPVGLQVAPLLDRATARVQLGCGQDEFLIATIGRAAPVKGWDLLLRAFARIAGRLPAARLLLVGSTSASHERPFFQQLQEFIQKHELDGRVVFTGHLVDPAAVLAAADVFVCPSRSEGFGLALVEAIDAGLPTVSTRVGIATNVIRPGHNGLLVNRADEIGLADALLRLGTASDLRCRLARGARNATLRFSLDEYARTLVELYATLLNGRGRVSTAVAKSLFTHARRSVGNCK